MKHYQTQQGVELTQYKLIKHFYTHLNTSNLRPERAKLTIRVQQTSNEFKSFHWNGTSVEIFLQLMENVFGIIRNSEFVDWFFFLLHESNIVGVTGMAFDLILVLGLTYPWHLLHMTASTWPSPPYFCSTKEKSGFGAHTEWVGLGPGWRNTAQDRDFTSILRTAIQLRPQFVILKVFFMGQFRVGIILKMIDRQCLLLNIKLNYKFTILMYVLIFHVELRGTVRWTLLRPASLPFSWQILMHNPHKRITCIPVIYIQQLDIKYLLNAELSLNFALLTSLIIIISLQE